MNGFKNALELYYSNMREDLLVIADVLINKTGLELIRQFINQIDDGAFGIRLTEERLLTVGELFDLISKKELSTQYLEYEFKILLFKVGTYMKMFNYTSGLDRVKYIVSKYIRRR